MAENFKNKGEKELVEVLKEKRNALRDFRFRISKGKAKDVKTGKRLRKEIAAVLTEMNGKRVNSDK